MRKDLIGEWAFLMGLITFSVFIKYGYKKSFNGELTDSIYSMIRGVFFQNFQTKDKRISILYFL